MKDIDKDFNSYLDPVSLADNPEFQKAMRTFATVLSDKLKTMNKQFLVADTAAEAIKPALESIKLHIINEQTLNSFREISKNLSKCLIPTDLSQDFIETLQNIDWEAIDSLEDDDEIPEPAASIVIKNLYVVNSQIPEDKTSFRITKKDLKLIIFEVVLSFLITTLGNSAVSYVPQIWQSLFPEEKIEHYCEQNRSDEDQDTSNKKISDPEPSDIVSD